MPALSLDLRMNYALVIGNVERASDHAAVLGVLVAIAVVGAVLYGLVRLVVNSRGRTRSNGAPGTDRGPET